VASGTSVTASKGGLTPDVVKVDASSSVGVTIGPNGVEPQVNGSAAADVMGRNLFGTKLLIVSVPATTHVRNDA
jgi:hypothetical protein